MRRRELVIRRSVKVFNSRLLLVEHMTERSVFVRSELRPRISIRIEGKSQVQGASVSVIETTHGRTCG